MASKKKNKYSFINEVHGSVSDCNRFAQRRDQDQAL